MALVPIASGALLGCGGGDDTMDGAPASEPIFPEDVTDRFTEARDCRTSIEHQLQNVRVFVNDVGEAAYDALDPSEPYPVGSQLVKVEYEDVDCEIVAGYTAMEKVPQGENPDGGDWRWQQVDLERNVLQDGAPSACVSCHQNSCDDGFDFTCTVK